MKNYDLSISFRCRPLTQAQGQEFWGLAYHFAAYRGKWKQDDRTVYRWEATAGGNSLPAVIEAAVTTLLQLTDDPEAEILSLSIKVEED